MQIWHRSKSFFIFSKERRRNKNLFPLRIPPGTSPELQNMLIGLLRRNAKERMPFDVFFNHSFLQRNPPTPQQAADLPSPFSAAPQKPSKVVNTTTPTTIQQQQTAANNNNNVKNGE
jgi:hypothetical protein